MPSKIKGHGRTGRPWRRKAAEVRASFSPCWLCGDPIDYTLPPNHVWSFTVHHKVPLAVAPWLAHDRSNLVAAHRRCNSLQGDRLGRPPTPTSRTW
ncbi:HNH endonuclease [Tenggerimyces flavus]|uniref:HNH endonuclease n=1 Tax=Tenggerimyces flavus TaxID=1708749 RepID=A0ABV7YBJ7_9ACTN|nr:5-methylcytosine-specific restriction endonuclease McrA [Tenggerimyces flavus]